MSYKTIDMGKFYTRKSDNTVILKRGINKEYEKNLERKAYLKALEENK